MGMMPPVVASLIADTKEYSAKMDESIAKMDKLGAASETTGAKMGAFASKAATAVIGLGVALGGYAIDKAYKFQEQLDQIRNQSGASASEVNNLGKAILNISSATGVTTTDLTQAGLAMEQAGIRGKAGQLLLLDASKAAVITGNSVVDVTKALISAQTLQIAKGMDVTKMTGLLVAGSKLMVGGMSAESAMLSGRVGVALASVGMKMKDVIAAGSEFSKVGLNSRATVSFATGLAKLNLPLDTVHVTAKKTYTTLSTYALSLQAVGLSQAKLASDLRTGGVAGLLTDIKDAAGGSTPKLQELLHVVFGTGAGTSQVLVNNLKQFAGITKSLNGAGATSLGAGFKEAISQLGPQFKLLMAQVNVLMIRAGKFLLPAVTDIAHWANEFFAEMKKHPMLKDILGVGAATVFGAAVALKVTQGIKSVMGLFNKGAQIDLLTVIARNTTVMAGEGGAGGGIVKGGSSIAKNIGYGGIIAAAGVFAAAAIASIHADPNASASARQNFFNKHGGLSVPPKPNAHKGEVYGPTRPGGTSTWHVKVTR